ncbi:MAG: class I SAM-dependent methyltransferase [Ignavibacteria bacterium]|nr:class I SAM-dependent methyltransferase [Ignavibacteria bacterium]
MTVQEHYANHLGNFYSWMLGDFQLQCARQREFFEQQGITPGRAGRAIDLGAGNGIHSIPLAEAGYSVTAVDFNEQLLAELQLHAAGLPIDVVKGDIRDFQQFVTEAPGLVLCCGDTIAHLESMAEIEKLVRDIYTELLPGGVLMLTFRDYSTELTGEARFIPVKQDENRIATCFLEYITEYVIVTDLLWERETTGWQQKVSSYRKVRVSPAMITRFLQHAGFRVQFSANISRMETVLAVK